MKTACSLLVSFLIWTGATIGCAGQINPAPIAALAAQPKPQLATTSAQRRGLPEGTPRIWKDRGELTPARVYWGAASLYPDPMSRLPEAPFSYFEKDITKGAWAPKAKLVDHKGIKWTAKFGYEARADTIAPRLAWALGFGAVEGYYVDSGKIEGVSAATDLGRARGSIQPDGSFKGGARFKRHNRNNRPIKDTQGNDVYWDEGTNPGVPAEQLSGLLIFDVMVGDWDAQPKNCKVYSTQGPSGPENWYIVSDMGASFSAGPKRWFSLAGYQRGGEFIKSVSGDTVVFNFADANSEAAREHEQVPLAHAQWFRNQLARLTDAEIQAAFDAGFATEGLNRAYASGDASQIKAARERELSPAAREEIASFVAKFRTKIDEFMRKIPAP